LDGTSKTISVGEAAYYANSATIPMWMGTVFDDGSILFKTRDQINCRLGGPRAFPLSQSEKDMLPEGSGSDDCVYSWHAGGAMFGFVDGSVHFVSDGIEIRTFALLGDRLDGEVVDGVN
jgi:prepilin-type processing-associated H-X9-DG protein